MLIQNEHVALCMSVVQTVSFIVFQATEWLNRKTVDGKVCIVVSQHKTATMQIATFALNMEEAAVSSLTG